MHIVSSHVCHSGLIEAGISPAAVVALLMKHAVLEVTLILRGLMLKAVVRSLGRIHLMNSAEFNPILIDLFPLPLLLYEYLMHLLLRYGRRGPFDLSVHILHLGHAALADR